MRILILQDYLRSGGTERQTVLLANHLATAAAAAHTVTLLTLRPRGPLAADLAGAVAHHALQPFDTGLDWFAPRLTGAVASAAPHVLLCMGRIANSYAAHLQRHHRRLPIVTTMRTGKKLPWAYRLGLRRTCHTVANSREAARSLTQDYAVPAEKISLIYNATVFPPEPRTDGTDAAAAALRTLHGATPQTPVMLCVAMFRPEKNQRELIALLARLPRDREWQLWLAGDGTARRACEKQIAALGLAARVKLLGFHHDPRPLYRAADIAVLTSRSESLPNFLIEAHAHRLPSLAYATGGVAECGGAVVPLGDQAAFLAALRPLLFDGTARAAAAETAAAHAAAHFSPAAQLAAYEKLFARLCHQ